MDNSQKCRGVLFQPHVKGKSKMGINLTKPAVGSTGWGSNVNQNWQDIEDALDGTLVVEDANAQLGNAAVLGSTVIHTAAYASRNAAGKSGRLFLPNDGFQIERDTGSAWSPWGPLFPFTPPVLTDFSWYNQGGATVSNAKGGIYLEAPAASGDNFRCQMKSAPSTPYTITMAFLPQYWGTNYTLAGFFWRDSSATPKFVIVAVGFVNGLSYFSGKYNSASSWNSTYFSTPFALVCPLVWLRLGDDGTNRTVSISANGQNFITIHTVSRTDFLTPTHVGFFANSNNSVAVGNTLLHWKEA